MKVKTSYPMSSKTNEPVMFKTSASLVYDADGVPVSDRLNKLDLYKHVKDEGYTGSNEDFIDDMKDVIVFDETEDVDVELPESEINDEIVSDSLTWSSRKINNTINALSLNDMILTDTNGNRYKLVVSTSGVLSVELVG